MELKNSVGAHDESDLEEEIPMECYDDFPMSACEFDGGKKIAPRRGKFDTERQNQKKDARRKSKPALTTVSIGGHELHPLIGVEDND